MSELTLEQKLESAKYSLRHAISRSYKTGYNAQADMITLYRDRVNELTKQIQNQGK